MPARGQKTFWRQKALWQKNTLRRFLVSGVVLLLFALTIAAPPLSAQNVEYSLGAGDQLRVTVFGQEDLSGEFDVGNSGAISLPLIGDVMAGGRTLRELEDAIVDKLKPDYLKSPRVSVDVLNYRPFYIIGEVKRPGAYPYVSGMRVVNAIALAGGYTYRAREKELLITRDNEANSQQYKADPNTVVLPGDVIEVPQRFF